MDLHELPLRLVEWRRDRHNSLVRFATVALAASHGVLTIRNIAVSRNCGSRFVAMAAGAYIAGGQAQYQTILRWDDIGRFRTHDAPRACGGLMITLLPSSYPRRTRPHPIPAPHARPAPATGDPVRRCQPHQHRQK